MNWKDVLKQDEIITIDEDGKVHLPAPSSDAAGPCKELLEVSTLHIGALICLVEGHRQQDKWERMDALRDAVAITRKQWREVLNRLKGDKA